MGGTWGPSCPRGPEHGNVIARTSLFAIPVYPRHLQLLLLSASSTAVPVTDKLESLTLAGAMMCSGQRSRSTTLVDQRTYCRHPQDVLNRHRPTWLKDRVGWHWMIFDSFCGIGSFTQCLDFLDMDLWHAHGQGRLQATSSWDPRESSLSFLAAIAHLNKRLHPLRAANVESCWQHAGG